MSNKCDDVRSRMMFYLDAELESNERELVDAHLSVCDPCRGVFAGEQRILDAVRAARPLQSASPELRARVEKVMNDAPVAVAPSELRQRVIQTLSAANSKSDLMRRSGAVGRNAWLAGLAAVVLLGAVAGLWLILKNNQQNVLPNGVSAFALMAADTHQRHLRGQLPLEISSDVPGQISQWFSGKVPFNVKLPNYQEVSGQEKLYKLEGARLVGYKDDYAAYVAYQMQRRPISLVVTSDTVAQPSGGEEIAAQGLTFHYNSIQGLKVITWSDRGLTYALVSDLEERGQQSCIVCHQGTKDKDLIEPLKPR